MELVSLLKRCQAMNFIAYTTYVAVLLTWYTSIGVRFYGLERNVVPSFFKINCKLFKFEIWCPRFFRLDTHSSAHPVFLNSSIGELHVTDCDDESVLIARIHQKNQNTSPVVGDCIIKFILIYLIVFLVQNQFGNNTWVQRRCYVVKLQTVYFLWHVSHKFLSSASFINYKNNVSLIFNFI